MRPPNPRAGSTFVSLRQAGTRAVEILLVVLDGEAGHLHAPGGVTSRKTPSFGESRPSGPCITNRQEPPA